MICLSLSWTISCGGSKPTPLPQTVQEQLPPLGPMPTYSERLLDLVDQIQPEKLRVEIKRELVKHKMDDQTRDELVRHRLGM